jgi:secreted protein with Ig-like and vWFA domain
VKAFQWFIENTGPLDDHPLLTVDMLWDFFYEKGRDNLSADIRLILDTFPQQQNLREDEKTVLKTILIMQAIDQRSGGTIELFKATEQNLSYAFEGISNLEGTSCINIAKKLVSKGVLVSKPIDNDRYIFG